MHNVFSIPNTRSHFYTTVYPARSKKMATRSLRIIYACSFRMSAFIGENYMPAPSGGDKA